jgi:diguanylate cyclase (GGDEF)-like protein
MAMNRSREEIYDPVVLLDEQGHYAGIITMKQLLTQFIGLEIKIAADANPLTNLPGNRIIEQWIRDVVVQPHFSILYADLDRFKEYNDVYGFSQGDRMIRRTASILSDFVLAAPGNVQLGHIGGDDFVIIVNDHVETDYFRKIVDEFETEVLKYYNRDDVERGYIITANRQNIPEKFPLTTLTVVSANNRHQGFKDMYELAEKLAGLKKAKKLQLKVVV